MIVSLEGVGDVPCHDGDAGGPSMVLTMLCGMAGIGEEWELQV